MYNPSFHRALEHKSWSLLQITPSRSRKFRGMIISKRTVQGGGFILVTSVGQNSLLNSWINKCYNPSECLVNWRAQTNLRKKENYYYVIAGDVETTLPLPITVTQERLTLILNRWKKCLGDILPLHFNWWNAISWFVPGRCGILGL